MLLCTLTSDCFVRLSHLAKPELVIKHRMPMPMPIIIIASIYHTYISNITLNLSGLDDKDNRDNPFSVLLKLLQASQFCTKMILLKGISINPFIPSIYIPCKLAKFEFVPIFWLFMVILVWETLNFVYLEKSKYNGLDCDNNSASRRPIQ